MYERFTDRARKVMQLANQEARRCNHEYIGTEHILLGLVKEASGVAANVLKNLDIDLRTVRQEVEKIVQAGPEKVTIAKLPQTPRAKKVIEYTIEEARNLNHNYVGTEHLLLGLLREKEGLASQVLMSLGLKLDDVRAEVLNMLGHNIDPGKSSGSKKAAKGEPKTPTLDRFGRNLTELVRQGKVDPMIGRVKELQRVVRVLCRRTKSCPILLGEVGVGKTAIVRGLAQLLGKGQVPPPLRDFRIVTVDLPAMVAGTRYYGHFEERMKAVANEARRAKDVILFLDDLHLWAYDKTVLAGLAMTRGDLRYCIAATTPAEYARIVAKVSTLGRFFIPIQVPPLADPEVLEILRLLRHRYESHHDVRITDGALTAALDLAARGGAGAALIDRALDLIDEAAAEIRSREDTPEMSELDAQLQQLNEEKEAAVAHQDFEKAVRFRDQADALRQKKESLVRAHREAFAVVTAEVIAEVAGPR
jgi:ATP-dependent Clp protease ATP-binding subunit ClpC